MADTRSKAEMLATLRSMLKDAFRLRQDGVQYARLARAHGYIDGYMRVLMETGVADHKELVALVAAVRRSSEGPATAEVELETPATTQDVVAA